MNDFLFSVVMRQEKYCKPLLEYILNVKIKSLKYIGEQKTIQAAVPTAKSIRLDVFVEDETDSVYDLEVQTTNRHNLGKRSRYYQSVMDVRVMEKGGDYDKLKKSFIIFICSFDPFKSSRYIYTFTTQCVEAPGADFEDEATKIVINTKGTVGDISEELKAVIKYMDSGIVSNSYTESLDAEVRSVKTDAKVQVSYMLLQEAFAQREALAVNTNNVMLIRRNMNHMGIADLSRILFVSADNCKSVIDTINAHPDWDDERVAEEIVWDK